MLKKDLILANPITSLVVPAAVFVICEVRPFAVPAFTCIIILSNSMSKSVRIVPSGLYTILLTSTTLPGYRASIAFAVLPTYLSGEVQVLLVPSLQGLKPLYYFRSNISIKRRKYFQSFQPTFFKINSFHQLFHTVYILSWFSSYHKLSSQAALPRT